MMPRHPRILGAGILLTALAAPACLAPDAIPGAGGAGGTTGTGGAPVALAWADGYGVDADSDQRAFSVTAAADGGAIVAGDFEGSLTVGSLPALQNTEGRDAFVFALDPSGAPLWLTGFTGLGDQIAQRAVPAPDGGVLVAGTFTQTLVFSGDDVGETPSGKDGFLARLDDERDLAWLLRASGDGAQTIQSVALAATGEAFIAGTFEGALDLGGKVLEGSGGNGAEIFVAKIDTKGVPVWITSLRGDAPDLDPLPSCVIALGPTGAIHVAGTFSGAVTFDENIGAIGGHDMFVGQLDAAGKPLWGHAIGSPGVDQRVASISVGPTGDTLIAADLRGKVTLDGTTIEAAGDRPDAFLAVYDAKGAFAWARRYGSTADDHAGSAAFDAASNIHFAGQFRGAIDFTGAPPLLNTEASAGADDIFFTVLAPDRAPLFATAFGGPSAQVATSIAVDASSQTLLAGWFRAQVDFGAGPLDAKIGDDLFVAKFEK